MESQEAIDKLRDLGYHLLGADARTGEAHFFANLKGPLAIVVGHETSGLSNAVVDNMDGFLALPMPGGAESLNAGVASSILLYEALRQRSTH